MKPTWRLKSTILAWLGRPIRCSSLRLVCVFVPLLLTCFALSHAAQAVSPPPDGGYPGGNTAEGQNALLSLTNGVHNTAVGFLSLKSNTTAGFNTAVGSGTLLANIADGNTATGTFALLSNTSGSSNTANGAVALFSNTEGNFNNAVGVQALYRTTTGSDNNALGVSALFSNTTGSRNNAFGGGALANLVSGDANTAVGAFAGSSLTTGNGNVYIGGSTFGQTTESDHTYIRNINTTSVSGMGTDSMTVNLATGLLGHLSSSRRFKEDIKPMENASETLYRLKPVTYHYKKEIDPTQSLDYGLVAEDVAKVDPNLANQNRDGQIESVRYNAVNAMLLNEFLKEHRKVQAQQRKIHEQEATIAELSKGLQSVVVHLTEQDLKIQKVSERLKLKSPPAQTIANNKLTPR